MNPEIPANLDNLDAAQRQKLADDLLQQIDLMHEAYKKKLAELDKKIDYFESRQLPLPDKLYHVTTKQNVQQIMKEGLDPSKLYLEDDEVVSLSDDIDFAKGVAKITQKSHPYNLVVLEIDTQHLTPSRVRNYLRKPDPDNPDHLEAAAIHEVHYDSYITPDAIKIVKPEKK